MDKIRLNKEEKRVFRNIKYKTENLHYTMSTTLYLSSLSTLKEKGLVDYKPYADTVSQLRLTHKGKAYLELNPKLRNPVNMELIQTIALIITAVAAIVALFLSCSVNLK